MIILYQTSTLVWKFHTEELEPKNSFHIDNSKTVKEKMFVIIFLVESTSSVVLYLWYYSLTNFTSSVYFWITKEMNSKIVNDKKFCQESLTFLSHWSQMLYCFCWWYVKSPLQYKTLIQLQSKHFIKRLKCLILKRVVSYLLCFTRDSALSSI